jgi:hypothetical protein
MHVPIQNTVPKLSVDDKPHTRQDGRPLQLGTLVTTLDIDHSGTIAMAIADGPTKRTKHIDVQHRYLLLCETRTRVPNLTSITLCI